MLAFPALIFVGVFALWPMAQFLTESVYGDGGFTLSEFSRLLTSETFYQVLRRTLTVALSVTAICIVLAYPTAYALAQVRGRMKLVLFGLLVLPYLTSVVVRTYAWAALLAIEGPINNVLVALGIFQEPKLLGHSDFGTFIGMVHILLPIAVLTLWSSLERIDPQQRQVALSLGATKAEGFFSVFLPQSVAGMWSAASLVYVLSLGAYVIPQTLGGTRGLLFAQLLVEQATVLLNWNVAAAMAIVLLLAAGIPVLIAFMLRWLRNRSSRRDGIGGLQYAWQLFLQPLLNAPPDWFWSLAWKITAGLIVAFLFIPELVVVVLSFGPERQITFPPAYFTLDGYISTLTNPDWMNPLKRSLWYALADALIATGLGALAAYAFARSRPAFGRIGTLALALPIVLPEVVIAISYFIFATRFGLAGTAYGIILGQGAAAAGIVVIILSGVMRQVDENLEYAAMGCGASRLRAVVDVVFPLVHPGLLVGFVYGYLHAFDNLVLPLFIAGRNDTITVRMFISMQEELISAPAVISALLILALMLLLYFAIVYAGRKAGATVGLLQLLKK